MAGWGLRSTQSEDSWHEPASNPPRRSPILKRKRSGSRSNPYRGQLPTVVRWSLGVVLGLAVLVAVAYLYGNPASKDQDFFTSLHETFRHPAVATVASL